MIDVPAGAIARVAAESVGGFRLAALPPLALYVHLPWCVRKCPYCDFNSHEARGALPEDDYVAALIADLESALPHVWGRRVQSVFFGGGTPSLFSARAIDRLLAALRARLPLEPDAEVTLEANPGTFEADKFREFRAAGVNRLSIGVQSFDPKHLRALGRIHDEREAQRAVEIAHAHFDNFNLDLMYALPEQTVADAERDVGAALAARAPHLSFYHLAIEPNTVFFTRPPPLPDEDSSAEIGDLVERRLLAAGYEHYETSAYARPGAACRHNLNYWRFGDYLGIGAGAHAKISSADRIVREARARTPSEYMQRVAAGTHIVERRELARRDLPLEFMMNALRLAEGFPVSMFSERTGLPIVAAERALAQAEARALLERDHERIRPTALGRRYLNDLLALFLPA
ncbi:MAG: oxygen-independent coproporphyrinogen III oxidase-like protein [Burkholderiales bacterium]|nr:oxygen-independent coproporphyrinogen III oxidase-like protein [Burkholderiales bacterium]